MAEDRKNKIMNTNPKTIMVVDDDPKIVKALTLRLKSSGYEVISTFNGMTAMILSRFKKPDLIIADIWMPAGCGLSLAYRMKEVMPGVPLIFLTASRQPGLEQKARELGASGYLEKPYDPGQLLEMVSHLLETAGQPPAQQEFQLAEAVNH
jgi:two-component system, NtrC family, response regulator GlrR